MLDGDAAAIPVVGGLHRRILQKTEVGVESQVGGSTESSFVRLSIAEQHTELIEHLLPGGWSITRRPEICISTTDGVLNEAIDHERGAGIDPDLLEIVVDVPLRFTPAGGLKFE